MWRVYSYIFSSIYFHAAIKLVVKTSQILRYAERKPFNFCAIICYRTIYTALDTLLSTLLLTLAIIASDRVDCRAEIYT